MATVTDMKIGHILEHFPGVISFTHVRHIQGC